ncbi:hypothetical protein ISF6_4408 [Piscinibacter sakaiensis]|uniref:Spore protein YkvP/CgeB glycosyl transferase-like domain-containing protein n=1 Tax=Piscinibacter sakaiensis TaxID=1547922 RepID=A0A0K8P6S0_PISS1|nr:hypothetical protein ISF6_4408 [Piscinibacter sakaiensis]
MVLAFDHPLRAVESVAERMAAGLACQGVPARACSLPRDAAEIAALAPGQVAGVLSLGPLPLSVRLDGQPLWERFPCRFDIFLLDAPIYDMARVPVMREYVAAAQRSRRLGLLSPETGYRDWIGEALPVRWGHLPFGSFASVALPAGEAPAEPVVPQPRLCVIGTVGSELGGAQPGETLSDLLGRVFAGRLDGAGRQHLDQLLRSPQADPLPARAIVQALGLSPLRALQADLLPVLIAADSWVKRERRLQAVRSLAGLPVDFFGSGWEALLGEVPGFRHVGQVNHDDIARLLPHYAALVNFDPNWDGGVHDRVYTATAMGVPVITNENSGLAAAALPDELLLRYDANRPALRPLVEARGWLAAPTPARPRAELLARHNWATRMGQWLTA